MPWGPWIQDPDITVAAGRSRTLRVEVNDLGPVHHSGTWTTATVNGDIGTTTAAITAAEDDNAEDYDYSTAAGAVTTARTVTLQGSHVSPGAGGAYDLAGEIIQETLFCNAYPHGWSPPFGAEVEGGADPVVIEGHVVLNHEQVNQTPRTPDHTAPARLTVYQHDATSDGHVVAGTGSTIATYSGLVWLESPATNVLTTTVDLAGDALNGAIFNPFLTITGSWAFGATPDPTLEFVQQFFLTDVDLDSSYYVWRPPRYRFFRPEADPARLLYPRTDDLGIGIGRIYPPPNTQQYGRRTGSSAPI